MDVEELRKRVDKESAEVHERLAGLYALSEQALDNHAMLMGGVQIAQRESQMTGERIDNVNLRLDALVLAQGNLISAFGAVATYVKGIAVLVVLLLAWQIGEAVIERGKPAQPMPMACGAPQAVAVAP